MQALQLLNQTDIQGKEEVLMPCSTSSLLIIIKRWFEFANVCKKGVPS
jgi:hypothetical protein